MRMTTALLFSLLIACSAGDSGGGGGGGAGMGGGGPTVSSLSASELMGLCEDLDGTGRALLSSKGADTCAVGALLLGLGEGSASKRQPTCEASFTACVASANNPPPVQCPSSAAGCEVTEAEARACVDAFAAQVNSFPSGLTCADIADETRVSSVVTPILDACSGVWAEDACAALWMTPGM